MGAPIGHTCPDIDKTIKKLQNIREYLEDAMSAIRREIEATNDLIERELGDIEDSLEELRSDNSSLREWGTENEDKVKELEEELSELQSIVS